MPGGAFSRTTRCLSCLLLVYVLFSQPGIAQNALLPSPASPTPYVHQRWTVEDGLPVDNLNDLVQTRDGYLWIATWDGLVRFDGARFTVFHVGNSDGLPSNRIIRLQETDDGTLWIATAAPNTVVRYRAGRFVEIPGDWTSFVTRFDEVGNRLFVFDNDRRLHRYRSDEEPAFVPVPLDDSMWDVVEDRAGVLWAAGDSGLARVPVEGWSRPVTRRAGACANGRSLVRRPDGALYMASTRGVARYDDGRCSTIPVEGDAWAGGVEQTHIASDGTVWAASGTSIYRLAGDRMVPARESDDGPWIAVQDQLFRGGRRVFQAESSIQAQLVDHEGSVWVATTTDGLVRLKEAAIRTYTSQESTGTNVSAVYLDGSGILWAASPSGNLYQMQNGVLLQQEEFVPLFWISDDRSGSLWYGGGALTGSLRIRGPTGTGSVPDIAENVCGTSAGGMYESSRGVRWFAIHDGGVCRLRDGDWTYFGRDAGLPAEAVHSIRETRDGAVWFITNGAGLVRFGDDQFTRFTSADGLSGNNVRGFYEDEDGVLWIGTYGRGLNRIVDHGASDLSEASVTTYGTAEGLYDDVVHAIVEDDSGRLWMSTNRGLFWVRRDELNAYAAGRIERVRSTIYDHRDGMLSREANGLGHLPGLKDQQGRLWFPTQNGVVMVDPSRIQPSTIPPPIVIETVVADDRAVYARSGPVRLSAAERTFEVSYTGLSYLAPERMRFRFMLEGYDDAWREVDRRTAFYTRVPQGTYTFRVVAMNKDGVWNDEGASVSLTVAPYFFETWWFMAACGLILVLAGSAVYRGRVRRLRLRQEKLERLVAERTGELRAEKAKTEAQAEKLRELDDAKNRFFANITHEFRTPLTLIIGPLKSALAGQYGATEEPLQRAHDMMLRNSRRLLRLINQILDLAKAEVGQLVLDAHTDDLATFTRRTVQAFAALAERRRIDLSCEVPSSPVAVRFDRTQLEKVLLNLLSNAIKFTEADGSVRVTLDTDFAHARIKVTDTGSGVEEEKLPHLFDRFYQTDVSDTRAHEGTGIGLALVKELVELHGGRISVDSTIGEGTEFRVRLPLATEEPASQVVSDDRRERAKEAISGLEDAADHVADPAPDRTEDAPHLDGGGRPTSAEPHQEADEEDRTTVLIVDDNADVRAFVRSILQPTYRVLEAGNGAAGLDQAKTGLPDLIISDVMMPRMGGLDFSKALKEDPKTDCIPVILLTARADTEDEVVGLETGADDYLTKPFEADVLRARVDGLISSRQRLRERYLRENLPDDEPSFSRSPFEQRMRDIVEERLSDPDFNPEALASEAAFSYSQLYRRLRDQLDESPSQFIRRVRVERAARLLDEDAGTISEIAYAVGFNSLSYFSRAFKERYDEAPSSYAHASC